MRTSYSLYELNEYIRRVIALNFTEPIWVHAEISQVKEVRGNVYLDLVHHDDNSGEISAQLSANIWFKSLLFLKNKLGPLLPSLLCEGSKILVKAQVDFHERYGMKLVIEDIDPSYTIGQMEINRQKIRQRLEDEGLLNRNSEVPVPSVLQRIAVISSENAAGYIDFIQHLRENPYGYKFAITLFPSAMQGQNTEKEICAAINTIRQRAEQYDCIAILRGGGSKLDLSWFDNYAIGAAIARMPLPVIAGIGHDIDTTITDMVACISCKTPTAVADYILQRVGNFETEIVTLTRQVALFATRILQQNRMSLQHTTQFLRITPGVQCKEKSLALDHTLKDVFQLTKYKLESHQSQIRQAEEIIQWAHPRRTLKRGFAIVRQQTQIITSQEKLNPAFPAEIEFFDGTITLPTHE